MKHKLRFLAMFLAVAILLPVGTAFAADAPKPSAEAEEKNEKPGSGDYSSSEEVIYALLNQGGDSEDIYSVVILNSETGGTADYFGPFLDVKNLTDTSEAVLKSGKVSVIIPKGRYYFQSRLAVSDLPWNIKIEYKLNGNIADPATLGGASGKLEINIKTSKNEAVDPKYYEAYIMQIGRAHV